MEGGDNTVFLKKCGKCFVKKEYSDYHRDKKKKDGHRLICKECVREYQKNRYSDPLIRAEIRRKSKIYREKNKEKEISRAKEWAVRNKERLRKYKKIYYQENKERLQEKHKVWLSENKERNKDYHRRYNSENKEKRRKKGREWAARMRKENPEFKIKELVSSAVRRAINSGKGGKTFEHLPYSPKELTKHLESQFEEWMTWENHGLISTSEKTWHIDHIYPQCSLPYDSLERPNFQKCWALTNLRPLEAYENVRKGKKLKS